MEVFLMLQVGAGPSSAGKSAAVSLLDWYDLDEEVLLVMERPVSSVDLLTYMDDNDGPLDEDTAKVLMLVEHVSVWKQLQFIIESCPWLFLKMPSF